MVQPLLSVDASEEQQRLALGLVGQALRDGASPSAWRGPGTPLQTAVKAPSLPLVQSLLHAQASPNETDPKGVSVLHSAVFDGQVEICRALLNGKADANLADRHGQTPLFFAPVRSICEVLFQHQADTNAVNHKSQTALHLAGRAGLSDVLLWLAIHMHRSTLKLPDRHGATAAYYARNADVKPDVLSKLWHAQIEDSHFLRSTSHSDWPHSPMFFDGERLPPVMETSATSDESDSPKHPLQDEKDLMDKDGHLLSDEDATGLDELFAMPCSADTAKSSEHESRSALNNYSGLRVWQDATSQDESDAEMQDVSTSSDGNHKYNDVHK